MPIPKLNISGELPEGIHEATLDEIQEAFGSSSEQRQRLMTGLLAACENFRAAGVVDVFVNGSFVTDKPEPADIDGCWSGVGNIDETKLDELFWNFETEDDCARFRQLAKAKYGVDFFIAEWVEGSSGKPFPAFFQSNRDNEAKGILKVTLNR